jgi:N-succinyldiaminopimelate aminotransferase
LSHSRDVSAQQSPRRNPGAGNRMQPFSRSIFEGTSALANELDAINLGQGFPDTDGPEFISEAAIAAIQAGRGNQYPTTHGIEPLRRAVSEHQRNTYGLSVSWREEVVVGTGASEVIAAAILALVEPGDEVLMLDPFFDLYPAVVAMAGGTRISVPLSLPNRRPDIAALRAAVTGRTRVILLNTPIIQPGSYSHTRSWNRSPRLRSTTTCWSSATKPTNTSGTRAIATSPSRSCPGCGNGL